MHSHSIHMSIMHTSAQKLLFSGNEGVFYHSFSCPASFTYETTLSVCQGALPSSICLLKQGEVIQSGRHMHSCLAYMHVLIHPLVMHHHGSCCHKPCQVPHLIRASGILPNGHTEWLTSGACDGV